VPVLETADLTSSDGTRLCFRTLGDGPPVVIAHGAFSTSDDYVPVAVRLASTHRVVLLDRRGYRGSEVGPGPATFAQDGEDLIALMRQFGPGCALFGHGAGALAALHAARAAPKLVSALALLEPPILTAGPARQPLLDQFRRLIAEGDDGAALVAFTSGTSVMTEDVAQLWMDSSGPKPRPSALAAGVGRDLEALVAFCPEFDTWRMVAVPVTLLLSGERGDDELVASTRRLAGVLPRSRSVVLPDRTPVVNVLDPEMLVEAIAAAFDTRLPRRLPRRH
jgi:pimeloyl-ACP methyl ester carboxylesterase